MIVSVQKKILGLELLSGLFFGQVWVLLLLLDVPVLPWVEVLICVSPLCSFGWIVVWGLFPGCERVVTLGSPWRVCSSLWLLLVVSLLSWVVVVFLLDIMPGCFSQQLLIHFPCPRQLVGIDVVLEADVLFPIGPYFFLCFI